MDAARAERTVVGPQERVEGAGLKALANVS